MGNDSRGKDPTRGTGQADANEDSAAGSPFYLVLAQFLATMEGLEEVLAVVSPHVDGLDARHMTSDGLASLAPISPERRAKLRRFIDGVRQSEQLPPPREAENENAALATTDNGGPEPEPPSGAPVDSDVFFMEAFDNDPHQVAAWARRLLHVAMAPRTQILNGSLLTVSVSAFEGLMAGVATQRYGLFPEALGDEREFSLADLKQYNTLEEVTELAVARRVESLLRKGLAEWSRWCGQNMRTTIEDLALHYATLMEAFQRRHLIVHNAGRVSRQYLTMCPHLEDPPSVGRYLPVDAEYLAEALDEILVAGALTVFVAWMKWADQDHARRGEAESVEFIYRLMKADRWSAVEHACATLRPYCSADGNRTVLMVNEWLAMKRQGRAFASYVTDWDVSALDDRFALAKAALLDDFGVLFAAVGRALQTRAISVRDVDDWPLLAEMREDPGYADILSLPEMTPPEPV